MAETKDIIEQARIKYESEDLSEASKLYLSALNQSESDIERAVIWAELSWTFYRMKSYDRAIEAGENVIAYDPEYQSREDIYRILGYSHNMLNHTRDAIKYLEKSLLIDRESEKQRFAVYELAKLYFTNQAYKEASALFDEVEAHFFADQKEYWLSTLFFQGFILYYQNKPDESREIFEKLLTNAENDARKASAMFGLAFITFGRQDYLKTINLCEAIIEQDNNFFDKETIGFLTAASFYHLGRRDVFEKYYEQLTLAYPSGRYQDELNALKNSKDTGAENTEHDF
ncbi:MAG: tetratricopeptide repeat protein [Calditrichaceae bacterium]